jgi:hypothetical protein
MPAFRNPSDALSDLPPSVKRRQQYVTDREARRVQIGIPISGDPRPQAGRTAPPYGVGLIPAIVTSAIGPCSGTTVGTGAAQLYYLASPDSNTVTADPDTTGTVTVLNWFVNTGTITVGTHIQVYIWSYAYWFAGSDC